VDVDQNVREFLCQPSADLLRDLDGVQREALIRGQNRRVFEDKLKTVTRRRMAKFGEFKVNIVQSTLYVEPLTEDCDLDGAWEACGTIFGVAQMCRCRACGKNLDAMFNAVCEYLGDELSAAGDGLELILKDAAVLSLQDDLAQFQ